MSRFPRWWFWAVGSVPAAVTAIGLTIQTSGIEGDIRDGVQAVVPGAVVQVYGRDVTIGGLQMERLPEARLAAAKAPGVRTVATVDPVLRPMRLVFQGGQVVVSGATGKDEWRRAFVDSLKPHANGHPVVDQTRTVPDTDFPITTTAAEAMVAVVTQQRSDLTIAVEAGQVTITGVVPDAAVRSAIVTVLRRFLGATTVIDQTRPKE
ncbi:BON domain-containing protein [Actinocrispum wychmicini]|uniref:BON domain-containing protein n=1 Tax=Actinocrispum wychmicini TaxID=1213861 RepID=A0A4R2III2_9PSEU|nr:BON domain-containing protein [Actinocrispum wychmicini]TCO44704.1 BON domain-containing protein [Actinocrispum wychmicini]